MSTLRTAIFCQNGELSTTSRLNAVRFSILRQECRKVFLKCGLRSTPPKSLSKRRWSFGTSQRDRHMSLKLGLSSGTPRTSRWWTSKALVMCLLRRFSTTRRRLRRTRISGVRRERQALTIGLSSMRCSRGRTTDLLFRLTIVTSLRVTILSALPALTWNKRSKTSNWPAAL